MHIRVAFVRTTKLVMFDITVSFHAYEGFTESAKGSHLLTIGRCKIHLSVVVNGNT